LGDDAGAKLERGRAETIKELSIRRQNFEKHKTIFRPSAAFKSNKWAQFKVYSTACSS
jgi:hypothetical protein